MRRIITAALCFIGTALAQTADWHFIHPDAKAFVGIKLRRLKESAIGKEIRSELQTQSFPDLSAIPGSDLVSQIDEVLISSPGRPEGAAEDAQPPVLIRITGTFEAKKVEAFFVQSGAKMQKYREYRVFRHKGDGDMAAALVDPHTLLLGDAPSLFASLERLEWTDAPKNPLLDRAIELQSNYDVWALFSVTPSSFTGVHLPQLPALDSLRGMELAVSVSDGMALRLGLNTDSPQDAATMAAGLKNLLLSGLKDHGAPPDLQTLVKNITFQVEQSSVRLQVKVSAVEMKKAMAAAHQRFTEKRAEIAAVPHTAQLTAPVPLPQPKGPRVVRIEGLDDGPREIPYNP
jgi:hypothetical protein